MSGLSPTTLRARTLASRVFDDPWAQLAREWSWPQKTEPVPRAPLVLLALDEKPKAFPPQFPQHWTAVLNGHTVRVEVHRARGVSYDAVARADGYDNYPYTGFASIAVWPDQTKMVDLWVEDSFRCNGLGQYLVEIVGEIWPDVVWVDTEQSRTFYDGLIAKGIVRRIKCGKPHPVLFFQSKYAMACV